MYNDVSSVSKVIRLRWSRSGVKFNIENLTSTYYYCQASLGQSSEQRSLFVSSLVQHEPGKPCHLRCYLGMETPSSLARVTIPVEAPSPMLIFGHPDILVPPSYLCYPPQRVTDQSCLLQPSFGRIKARCLSRCFDPCGALTMNKLKVTGESSPLSTKPVSNGPPLTSVGRPYQMEYWNTPITKRLILDLSSNPGRHGS